LGHWQRVTQDEEEFGGADADAAEEETVDQEMNTDARQGRKGRGLERLPLEFVHLSQAYRGVTLVSVKGTDQCAPQYKAAVADTFLDLLDKLGLRNIDTRKQRSTNGIMRVLRYKVFSVVLNIKDSYLAGTRREMTGILTEEQMENSVTAYFNGHRGGDLHAAATRPRAMSPLKYKNMDSVQVLRVL